ncbi:MAG: diversity-generating retroelement protein Avd [Planctomycetes bacterium]|nr:diversity-generating retroelement protein Avd [Planctomycetota bacterium]
MYDALLWLVPEIGKFPRSFRFTLGEKLESMLYGTLDDLVRARYARTATKKEILGGVNVRLERIRVFFRLSRDLKVIGHDKHERAIRDVDSVGRQVGGWIKSLEGGVRP